LGPHIKYVDVLDTAVKFHLQGQQKVILTSKPEYIELAILV